MALDLFKTNKALKILTVPGLNGSGYSHWQTRWEKLYGFSRIEQNDWDNPDFFQWAESLRQSVNITSNTTEVILVAHSLGCYLVAKSFPLIKNIVRGVFLVAPPDLGAGVIKKDLSTFYLSSLKELEIPGCLVYSVDDPYASAAYSEKFGHALGLKLINVGMRGHINSDSHLGDWDEGAIILDNLLQTVNRLEQAQA
jgi:predicted alpha/beta hydrolase family esterase